MKKILIPVEGSALTRHIIDYIAALSKDFPVEEIILVGAFFVPEIAMILPSPDMLPAVGKDDILKEKNEIDRTLNSLIDVLRDKVGNATMVRGYTTSADWLQTISNAVATEKPDILVLGSDPDNDVAENVVVSKVVPIAKISHVPILLIPYNATFHSLTRALIPVSFNDLSGLRGLQQLCKSQAWLKADITVLNICPQSKSLSEKKEDQIALDYYLSGFPYVIHYSSQTDIIKQILAFADINDVQVIFALPGKHSFFHQFVHQSISKGFALASKRPVLILK